MPQDFAAYWRSEYPEDAAREAEREARLCRICQNFAYRPHDVTVNLSEIESSGIHRQCPDCLILLEGIQKYKHCLPLGEDLVARWNTSGSPPDKRDMLHISIFRTKNEGEKLRLEFHTRHGNPENRDRIGPADEVIGRAESEPGLERIRDWVLDCSRSHSKCNNGISNLPKRVIDVGSGDRSKLVRLYQGYQERERYVSLSHCVGHILVLYRPKLTVVKWGSPGLHTLPPKTLQSNINDREKEIPWSDLTKTFQEAIELTRMLGIRYIWIDSLCIIQDSKDDWEEQSSLLGKIFEGSYLTMVATHASCGADGLFTSRAASEEIRSNVFVRKSLPHDAWFTTADARFHQNSVHATLRRGWCYSEETLSTRLIHFTKHEMVWVCKSTAHCECGFQENFNYKPSPGTFPTHNFRDQMNSTDVVKVFSATDLTRVADRLPALSAIASQVHAKTGDTYLAGIWRANAIQQMGWYTSTEARQALQYIAPSFSWASINAKVSFALLHLHDDIGEFPVHATVCHGQCEIDGIDAFGRVSDGSVTLRGNLVPVAVSKPSPEDRSEPLVKFKIWSRLPKTWLRLPKLQSRSGLESISKYHIDSLGPAKLDTEDDLRLTMTRQVYCLPLYSIDTTYRDWDKKPRLGRNQTCFNCLAALLLVEYPRSGVYKRIGMFETWSQILIEKDYCLTTITIK